MDYGLRKEKSGKIYFNPVKFMKSFLMEEGKNIVKDTLTKEYYEYEEEWGIYVPLDIEDLKSDLMYYFNDIVKDGWKIEFENQYLPVFHNMVPRVDDFNQLSNIIVFSNRCYDIKRKRILPHNQKWKKTVRIPFKHDEGAECPLFNKYLREVSDNDVILENTLEELLGYMLFPGNCAHKMFVFWGEGSNSKSTFMTLLRELVGSKNTSAIPLKDFERSFTRHALKDTILNLVPEGEFLKVDTLMSGIVKQYITGDEISAEIKGGETYTYTSNLKIIMALNQLPASLLDTTFAVQRRLLILPFRANFKGKKLDRKIGEKLKSEMSGIINRALKGLERLEKNDFNFPFEKKSCSILNELFKESDPLHHFVDKYIVLQEGSKSTYEELLLSYGTWCKINDIPNQYHRTSFSSVFRQILRSKNFPITSFNSNGKRGLRNIKCTLKEQERES